MDRIAWDELNSMISYAVDASLTEARSVIVLWSQRKAQGVVPSNNSLSISRQPNLPIPLVEYGITLHRLLSVIRRDGY